MKNLLLTTIAAVLVVGCGESQQLSSPAEAKPEPTTAKAPDISIHDAAAAGDIDAVKQHIAAGADVNENVLGTPLHWATVNGHKEIAELLIDKGADVNAKNDEGGTPRDWAECCADKKEPADLLRKHGGKTGEELKAEAKK